MSYIHKAEYHIQFNFRNEEDEYTVEEETSKPAFTHSNRVTTKVAKHKGFLIHGEMSPGNLTALEVFKFYGVHQIVRQIELWVINLWDDISAEPVMRELQQQKDELNSFVQQFQFDKIPDGDAHFSKEETEELKKRLKHIEQQLANDIKQAIEDKDLLKKELNELKKEFETLKQTLPHLSKKGWVKSTLSKLYVWGSKKENQQLIKSTAKYGKALIDLTKDNPQ